MKKVFGCRQDGPYFFANKKDYDPRVWIREGEVSVKKRLVQAYEELNGINALEKSAAATV